MSDQDLFQIKYMKCNFSKTVLNIGRETGMVSFLFG